MDKIIMEYQADSVIGGAKTYRVEISGDGSLDHCSSTFEAFLITCGYRQETINQLVCEWSAEREGDWVQDEIQEEKNARMKNLMEAVINADKE